MTTSRSIASVFGHRLWTERGRRLRKQASKPTSFAALRYSAATGDATLVNPRNGTRSSPNDLYPEP